MTDAREKADEVIFRTGRKKSLLYNASVKKKKKWVIITTCEVTETRNNIHELKEEQIKT